MKRILMIMILLLAGFAVGQDTETHCKMHGDSTSGTADCTTKEQNRWYGLRYETESEHRAWEARQRAKKEEWEAQQQREARQREIWLATPEGQKQAKAEYEARQAQEQAAADLARVEWLKAHPKYPRSESNDNLMKQYLLAHRLDVGKTKSYDKAFEALSKSGLLEGGK